MKRLPLLFAVLLGAGLTGVIASSHQQPTAAYSVSQVVAGLRQHPTWWRGRIVAVQGVAHLTGIGPLPSSPPVAALADAPPATFTIAGIDVGHLVGQITGQRAPSSDTGVLLRQAPSSHQQLAWDQARTYRVRVETVACPSGQCPLLTIQ